MHAENDDYYEKEYEISEREVKLKIRSMKNYSKGKLNSERFL